MSISRARLLQQFEQEYAFLSPQQKLAVDTAEGLIEAPAGHGVGKIDLLAIRMGKLLLSTSALPETILCFSRTADSADAIRQHLALFTGPEALRVLICTFDQFCQSVVEQNAGLFKEARRLLLSKLERIDLFIHLIDAFPKGHPLKQYKGNIYREMGRLQSLFSTIKKEGWTPDFISQQVNTWLKEHNRTEEEKEQVEQLLAAAAAFHHYQQLLQESNRRDDDDMLAWVIDAFETNPILLQRYQQQFVHLLTDEYEQLNSSQRKLIALLTQHRQHPNLFVTNSDLLKAPVDNNHHLDLFEEPLVQKIMLLLDYLTAENDIPGSGDELLFELLHADWFGIPAIEITKMAIELAGRQHTDNNTSLRRLLYAKAHAPAKDLFTPPPPEGIRMASKAIEHLVQLVPQVSLPALFDNIIRETGILSFILKSPDKVRLRELVTNLLDIVKADAERNPSRNLQQLVKLLTLMKRQHIPTGYPLPASFSLMPAEKEITEPEVLNRLPSITILEAPEIDKLEESLISRLLEKFMMSASALNNYLHCPLEFYYRNLIRIPSPRNEAAEFGSAVHYALEQLFRKMQADHEAFPSKAIFISDFEVYMQQHRGSFTPEQFARRMDYGYDVLSDYYDEYIHRWNTIVAVERNIRNVIVSGVPLKGKIDKLEFDGRSVNIVDYKTGDPEKAKLSFTRPGPQWPMGGNYWRQAVFYKILVDNYQQKEWRVASAELDLVEPDRKKRYHKEKLFITPDDVDTVTQQITTTWWRIQNRDFYTGCGEPGCHWCKFVRINHLAVAWHPLKKGEL